MPVVRNHLCQTPDCDLVAEVCIVRLSDSSVDLLCDTCAMAMWMAIAAAVAESAPEVVADSEPVT